MITVFPWMSMDLPYSLGLDSDAQKCRLWEEHDIGFSNLVEKHYVIEYVYNSLLLVFVKHYRDKMKRLLCKFILPAVVLTILLFVPLFILDIFHLKVDNFFESTLSIKNYFKGELWFSAIATCLAALPGIYVGLLALKQTNINYQLESRYHRPSIRLNSARITVDRIHDETYSDNEGELFRCYVEKLRTDNPQTNLITCFFDIEVLNDIEIQKIVLKKTDFYLGNKMFTLELSDTWKEMISLKRRCFWREILNGKRVYRIKYDLYPYSLQNVKSKKDKNKTEREFWQAIEYFLNYENFKVEVYGNMDLLVQAEVYYEYAPHKCETVYGLICWNHQQASRVESHGEAESCDGYFSYEPIEARRIEYKI